MRRTGDRVIKLNKWYGISNPPTLVATTPGERPITFSRLHFDMPGLAVTNIAAEDAYVIQLHVLRPMSCSIHEGGKGFGRKTFPVGSQCFFDLASPPSVLIDTPFDTIRTHIPLAAIQETSEQSGGRRQVYLKRPPFGTFDPMIGHLICSLTSMFEPRDEANALFIDHIALALQAHLVHVYASSTSDRPQIRGGLTPWQERRALELMDAALDRDVTIAELAAECGLSASHFARAFKRTVGRPPYRWFLEHRVEVAQKLLLKSDMSIEEIARTCGFSDQNHLTRAFVRVVGKSPGAWRRARRS
jgi:AraC-like DNA-binding protein